MPTVPQRISLIAQTKDVLIRGIAEHHWQGTLPGERRLCETLQVSRWTLRAALAGLAEEKLIRIAHGRPCEIVAKVQRKKRKTQSWRVGVIYPESFLKLRPFVVQMFDEIRSRVQMMGGALDVYSGRKYYGASCAHALTELVGQNPHACWIMSLSTRAMQRWFEENQVPAIVGGSLHDGINLPSINVDYRAIGRHAGGILLSRGHQRVALLASNRGVTGGYAGGNEIEWGLRDAFSANRNSDQAPVVVYHSGNPREVCQILERLRKLSTPPTALLIADSPTLLTAITYLAKCQVQVPSDLSLVVAEDEPYYPQIVPELSHYVWPMEKFTVNWCRLIRHALDRTLRASLCVRILPRFVPGKTLSPYVTR